MVVGYLMVFFFLFFFLKTGKEGKVGRNLFKMGGEESQMMMV